MLAIPHVRKNHQNSVFLINPAEIKQIAVLPETHGAIGVGWHNIIANENSKGVGLQLRFEPLAIINEKVIVDRIVFHYCFSD